MIEITGVDLSNFIKACYAPSRPQGLGAFHYQAGDLDDETVAAILARGEKDRMCAVSMDYVRGLSIKMTVHRGQDGRLFINNDWYDHSRSALATVLTSLGLDGEKLVAEAVAEADAKRKEEDALAETELPTLLAHVAEEKPRDLDGYHWRTRSLAEYDRKLIAYDYDARHYEVTDAGRQSMAQAASRPAHDRDGKEST